MKTIRFFFTGMICLSLMTMCKGPEIITVPLHDSTSVTDSEVITENPTWTDPESLLYRFAFECDSAYNVILKKYNEINTGIRNTVEIKEVVRYRADNTKVTRLELDISVLVDSIEVQNRTISRLRKEISTQDIAVPVEVKVKYIPKYHKFTAWGFPGLIILLLVAIYLKFKTKFFRKP